MPYVIRDASGTISRATVRAIHGAEMLPFDHPDFLAFLKQNGQDPTKIDAALTELRRTDMDMSRIVEDVVMVLLKKNILKMNELPQVVQEKMSYRLKQRMIVQDILDKASSQSGRGDLSPST